MQVALNLAASPAFSSVPPTASNSCKLPTTGFQSTKKTLTTTTTGACVFLPKQQPLLQHMKRVFPAEACETIGGDACLADMYPEAKLQTQDTRRSTINTTSSELVDRDYLQYTDPKTVLLGEACDVLGGEFCERPYQMGVY